jgi:hypothetical protein
VRDALPFEERLDASLNVFGPTRRFRGLARSQGWTTPRDLVIAGPEAVADIVWRRRGTPADTAEIRARLEQWLGCFWEDARAALGLVAPGNLELALLEVPLFTLPLGRAVIRVAANLGWKTVGDLAAVPPDGFEKLHRIGPERRRHVESILKRHLKMPWAQARRQMQLAQGPVRSRPPANLLEAASRETAGPLRQGPVRSRPPANLLEAASRETAGPLRQGRPAASTAGNEEEREGC